MRLPHTYQQQYAHVSAPALFSALRQPAVYGHAAHSAPQQQPFPAAHTQLHPAGIQSHLAAQPSAVEAGSSAGIAALLASLAQGGVFLSAAAPVAHAAPENVSHAPQLNSHAARPQLPSASAPAPAMASVSVPIPMQAHQVRPATSPHTFTVPLDGAVSADQVKKLLQVRCNVFAASSPNMPKSDAWKSLTVRLWISVHEH